MMQLVATVWPRAGKERQPETVLHRVPFHMPEPAVVATTWHPHDCIPQVEKYLRSLGTMPPLHFTNPQKIDIQRTKATTEFLRNRLKYPIQRSTSTNKLPHSTLTAAFSTISYDHTESTT
jgi:hypothetical protein